MTHDIPRVLYQAFLAQLTIRAITEYLRISFIQRQLDGARHHLIHNKEAERWT
jgi:hypothetical protein